MPTKPMSAVIATLVIIVTVVFMTVATAFALSATYTYDDLDRLKSVTYSDGTVIGYDYDKTGNRTQTTSSNTPTDFSASVVTGNAPLAVDFTDLSGGSPTAWLWNFGDGTTSTQQNPTHTYTSMGDYTVSLTMTNSQGVRKLTKDNYISTATSNAPAGAAEINIYGSSSQFDFLNAIAVKFVKKYCTASVPADPAGNGYVLQYKTTGGNTVKNGIVTGSSCSNIPGSSDTNLVLRYNGIASGEGIQAANKTIPLDSDLNSGCNVAGQRRMAPITTMDSATLTDADLPNYRSKTVCAMVNIGTSDASYDNFDQFYSDELVSADGTNTVTPLPGFTHPAGNDNLTVAVPFAFYVNPGVTAFHCVDNLVDRKKTGGLCTTAGVNGATVTNTEQCATGSVCETTPSTIDNISRLQANILYAGQITNWNQLGGYFTSNPVKICMRKPGSGTLVAFDKTVMTAGGRSGWGADYNVLANNDLGNVLPYTYFNGSSTDMKNCIGGGDGFKQPDGVTAVPATGAVGYLVADTVNAADKYIRVKYNGVAPNRTAVRNGAYEFYTIGHMYADVDPLSEAVVSYVQDPANIPSGMGNFWASVYEMKFVRGLDTAYPSRGVPIYDVSP